MSGQSSGAEMLGQMDDSSKLVFDVHHVHHQIMPHQQQCDMNDQWYGHQNQPIQQSDPMINNSYMQNVSEKLLCVLKVRRQVKNYFRLRAKWWWWIPITIKIPVWSRTNTHNNRTSSNTIKGWCSKLWVSLYSSNLTFIDNINCSSSVRFQCPIHSKISQYRWDIKFLTKKLFSRWTLAMQLTTEKMMSGRGPRKKWLVVDIQKVIFRFLSLLFVQDDDIKIHFLTHKFSTFYFFSFKQTILFEEFNI